jgi:hypothetical protein
MKININKNGSNRLNGLIPSAGRNFVLLAAIRQCILQHGCVNSSSYIAVIMQHR